MNKADVFSADDKKIIQKDLGKLKEQVVQPRRPPPGGGATIPYGMPGGRRW